MSQPMPRLTCLRCGHHWTPQKNPHPDRCGNNRCRTPYWDQLRTETKSRTTSLTQTDIDLRNQVEQLQWENIELTRQLKEAPSPATSIAEQLRMLAQRSRNLEEPAHIANWLEAIAKWSQSSFSSGSRPMAKDEIESFKELEHLKLENANLKANLEKTSHATCPPSTTPTCIITTTPKGHPQPWTPNPPSQNQP